MQAELQDQPHCNFFSYYKNTCSILEVYKELEEI